MHAQVLYLLFLIIRYISFNIGYSAVGEFETVEDVLGYLMDLHLSKLIFSSMVKARTGINGIAVVGPAGTGKTTYVYYAAKAAYIRFLCNQKGYGEKAGCIKYITGNYNLCFGRKCREPDDVDKMIRDYLFVGEEDILRLRDVLMKVSEEGRNLPFAFLDDLIVKFSFHAGGVLRDIAIALNRFAQYRRTFANVVIITSTHKNNIINAFSDFIVIHAREQLTKYYYVRYRRIVRTRQVKLGPRHGFMDALVTGVTIAWTDEIPRKSIFATPRWLEEEVDKRKRSIVLSYFNKFSES